MKTVTPPTKRSKFVAVTRQGKVVAHGTKVSAVLNKMGGVRSGRKVFDVALMSVQQPGKTYIY